MASTLNPTFSPHPPSDMLPTADCSTPVLPKTVLRLKRRLEESPSKVLVMSYKRCRISDSPSLLGAEGGGQNVTEEINRVFHLAGTVDKDEIDDDKSISKTIKEALEVVAQTKALERLERQKASETNRCYKPRRAFRHADKAKQQIQKQNRFMVISQKRGLPTLEDIEDKTFSEDVYEPTLLFNLLDLVAEDETGPSEKKIKSGTDPRNIGSITMNGVPMVKNVNSDAVVPSNSGFVFDLYIAKDAMAEDQFQNQFVSVRPADEDYEFDLNCYDSDEEFRPDDDDDSNDEGNWRNDYPDSDPDNESGEGFSYEHEEPSDDEMFAQFANFKLKGNDLSSDDEGNNVYSTEYDGCDDGVGGMYNLYKHRLQTNELADEVVSSSSSSDCEDD